MIMKSFFYTFLLLVAMLFCSTRVFAAEAIGQVVWVKGAVQAIDLDKHTRTLQRRAAIYEHDTIITGTGSAQIIFTDNSTVALREGTTFRIDEYKFNPSSPSESKYVAGIATGGFRTITGLISKNKPENYEVKTPVATIGVRGTDYSIFYSPKQGLSVKLDKGAMFVSNQAGTAELNKAKNQVFAEIAGVKARPVITNKPSPTLSGQPTITNASGTAIPPGGAGTVAPPHTKNITPKNPSSPTHVTGFCIN